MYATRREFTGSISYQVTAFFFQLIQPLYPRFSPGVESASNKNETRNPSGSEARLALKADNAIFEPFI
jgi:hypothetical protein